MRSRFAKERLQTICAYRDAGVRLSDIQQILDEESMRRQRRY